MLQTAAQDSAAYWRSRLAGLGDKSGFPADLRPADLRPADLTPADLTPADLRPAGPPQGEQPGEPRPDAEARLTELPAATLPQPLTERLDRLSRNDPPTLHVVLTAALAGLLGRYLTGDEVVVGVPANPVLVLRVPVGGSFRELLTGTRDAVRQALPHRDFPVQDLAGELGRAGTRGEHPYVDVACALAGLHSESFADEVPLRMLLTAHRDVHDGRPGLRISLSYDATRYTGETAARIGRQYARLLELAVADPDRPLAELDLRTADDEQVVAAANATDREFDQSATVHGLFERQAAASPHAPALLAGENTVTFAELDARSNRLARTLRERGAGPDRVVGVLAERSVELVVAIMAILKAGAAYLPIDPGYPRARIDYLLRDSGARIAVAQARFAHLTGGAIDGAIDLDNPASYHRDATPLDRTGTARDLAYVIYTSGSTGDPKGVMVEHRSVVNRLLWMQRAYPIGPGDVILQKTSVSFDVSVWELFWWAITGAQLALLQPGGEKDPAAIVAAVHRHRVTTMHFVPSMLNLFLGHVDRFGDTAQLASLRTVFASGEALPPNSVRRFRRHVPGARLVNLYGPTEATVDVTHQPCDDVRELARVPIGRPIDNTRLYVLDADRRPLPVGVPGELYIGGVGVARGYLNRDELTASRFVTALGERLYRTGDRARWLPDGSIDYLGRIDLQVKVRGFRVEPGEIEERLRAHPAVADAAVVPRDDGWQTSLRGYVVAAGQVREAQLKAHLREHLPEYMVPARIEVVDALPTTPNGKLDRAALARPRRAAASGYVAPRDERERTLATIWAEVLGVPRVGATDNFFALGGNSIHFVTVLARARAAGLSFTFQQLFQHQTVAALAASITASTDGSATGSVASSGADGPAAYRPFELLSEQDRALVPAGADDAYPLSLLQAGLIFQTEITGGLGQYHDVLGYLIRGSFDAAAFEQAVREMVRRHPILRTTYHLTGFGEFVQVVQHDVEPPMTVIDLRGRGRDEQEQFNEEWVAREKARPFVWEQGALVSLHVQILGDDLFRYTVSQHNSALDGWSISLLHTQLFDTYFGLRDGRRPAPHEVDNHLRNFVALEREAVASAQSRGFWLGVLRGASPTEVPRRPGAVDTADFEVVLRDVPLPAGLTERVLALADELSVPMKDVLLAAHVKVIGAVAGRREVLTGYEHSGRPELPGAEAALGLFLNTVPLRVELADESWAELVRRVYRAELDLLPHRRYPMARMKQDAGTREPLFETTFNYTHFYLLKSLRELPEFALLDMRVDSETEFVFRTEFSRHFFDDQLRLALHYHSHLFDAEQIDRIGGYFVRVLELMTSEPGARHDAHPLLDGRDRALQATVDGPAAAGPGALGVPEPVAGAVAGDEPIAAATLDRVAAVWSEVLDLPAADIDANSDFFALGGNSLSALRVVLELDGMVTLTDLNRQPRLADVASLLEQRQQPGHELLQPLAGTGAGARCALVCVPYPCGHPINFAPLAEAMRAVNPEIAVYGVEQPGHQIAAGGRFTPVPETARLLVAELGDQVDTPIVLWGHCGGAAVTLEAARQLEEAGFDLRHVFVGSKLLPAIQDMRESIEMIESWTDERIIRFMVDETGYTDLDGLDQRHTAFMASVFRHDVLGGFRYFVDASQRLDWKLATPLTFAVAADDAGLAHYQDEYRRWQLIASDVRLRVLGRGGHYFVRTNPAETAELVDRVWREG